MHRLRHTVIAKKLLKMMSIAITNGNVVVWTQVAQLTDVVSVGKLEKKFISKMAKPCRLNQQKNFVYKIAIQKE